MTPGILGMPGMPDRSAVVAEARSWVGTPYLLRGHVKGQQVDCGSFPYLVYRAFNLIPEFPLPRFSPDWWAHTTDERYLMMIQRYLKQLPKARAFRDAHIPDGCLALVRTYKSPVYNHAGIVTGWPRLVHAISPKVEEVDAIHHPFWAGRELEIFDPWADQ